MTRLTVMTPSYAPDFDSFVRLHRSVQRFTNADVQHIAIVPSADRDLFASIDDSRLQVVDYRELLPRSVVQTGWIAHAAARVPRLPRGARIAAINLRRPWPPLRGWVIQQLAKLAAASAVEDGVIVFLDSDAELIRPIDASTFSRTDGTVRFYRKPDAVTDETSRHMGWHRVARELIGTQPLPGPRPDFIAGLVTWNPAIVRACLAEIENVTGRRWVEAVGGRRDFSEYQLYGEFLDEFGTSAQTAFTSDDPLCHSHWEPRPMTQLEARAFVDSIRPDDVAIHVQSNSDTSADVIRYVRTALALA
ncbi:DUF6492 family protein [Gryllotalpicola protaetiae]|uniref:Uncharacterized protein n=1 Tax=Gryllotalpicola protaetiae TaxID=2419771 RepID=A0A387BGZ8_9MICO|nr:DUF6492 family protein [Gryllotalpicola protaetiae]AYG03183.1 hypothetical protein D7I44_06330 [Gryllotalpicola protaetiae]